MIDTPLRPAILSKLCKALQAPVLFLIKILINNLGQFLRDIAICQKEPNSKINAKNDDHDIRQVHRKEIPPKYSFHLFSHIQMTDH